MMCKMRKDKCKSPNTKKLKDLKDTQRTFGLKTEGSRDELNARLNLFLDEWQNDEDYDDMKKDAERKRKKVKKKGIIFESDSDDDDHDHRFAKFSDVKRAVPFFYGNDDEDVRKWLNNFEECAKRMHWCSLEKLIFARQLMKGDAQLFLHYFCKSKTYKSLKKGLLDEFGDEKNDLDVTKLMQLAEPEREKTVEARISDTKNRRKKDPMAQKQKMMQKIDDDDRNESYDKTTAVLNEMTTCDDSSASATIDDDNDDRNDVINDANDAEKEMSGVCYALDEKLVTRIQYEPKTIHESPMQMNTILNDEQQPPQRLLFAEKCLVADIVCDEIENDIIVHEHCFVKTEEKRQNDVPIAMSKQQRSRMCSIDDAFSLGENDAEKTQADEEKRIVWRDFFSDTSPEPKMKDADTMCDERACTQMNSSIFVVIRMSRRRELALRGRKRSRFKRRSEFFLLYFQFRIRI